MRGGCGGLAGMSVTARLGIWGSGLEWVIALCLRETRTAVERSYFGVCRRQRATSAVGALLLRSRRAFRLYGESRSANDLLINTHAEGIPLE